jgi:hypothetical protein
MEMTFKRVGTPNMVAYVNQLDSGEYTLTEVIDIASESVAFHEQTSRKVLFDASFAEIGDWLYKNKYYIHVHGYSIFPNLADWSYSAEADHVRRQFIGHTIIDGEIVPVLWDKLRKTIGPLEIEEAKSTLIKYITEATGDHKLRVIFEMYGKLGKLI